MLISPQKAFRKDASPSDREKLDIRVFLALAGLYVAQAIPIYFIAAALPAILRSKGVDLVAIGSFAILMLPWVLKFLWAPFVDRWGNTRFGPRKSWIVPMQLVSIGLILFLSQLEPAENLSLLFPLLMLMAICSATQDIATDGYAVEHLPPSQIPLGNAIQGGSVAAGVIVGGSLTLFVHDFAGWQTALVLCALLAFTALLPALFLSEDTGKRHEEEPLANQQEKASLKNFFKAGWAVPVLLFAFVFRLPEGLVKGVEQAFLVDQGLSLTKIGLISGTSAACVGLGGAAIAVFLIKRFGLLRFFWMIGGLRIACFALYFLFAQSEQPPELSLILLSGFHTFIRYMEIVALYSAFMRFSSLQQAGTDFTILSCANLSIYMLGGFLAGVIAEHWGYSILFALAVILAVPGILLAMRLLSQSQQHASELSTR
ncbi:MFS transporter [Kiloniella sp. b19]|uniref:MFS transporter n=1 Tax=Kiloniella sp. GXU_MW_B19 TaxID=3141326 RepID=UPI0031E24105